MARGLAAGATALFLFGCDETHVAGLAVAIDPAALYTQNCSRCHGGDGKGDPELKKIMPVRDLTDPTFVARASNEEIERMIMGGRNQMPAFGGSLSLPKIQSVTGYVRRLGRGQGQAARPPSEGPKAQP